LRLITNSYLVGACTGRSAGFAPLRMRPQVPYEACLQQLMQYRLVAEQQRANQIAGMGVALQNAGAALQSASPPPPQRLQTTCTRMGNMVTCN
jgi:hypothetical protein